jgi:uncharacterized protein (TIGR02453 family)
MVHVPALIQYLQGLSENNNKAWFVMNKPSYDILREEFTTLVAEVITRTAAFDPPVAAVDPKKAIFRIYRDVRFAHDKTPYKTSFSAAIAAGGKKSQGPMYYFHISADGALFTAAGCYRPEKDLLGAIRRHIADHPQRLKKLLANKEFVSAGGFSEQDRLVRPPKGYEADTPYIELIRLKSFVARQGQDISKRVPKDLAGTIATRFEAMHPLLVWLREAEAVAPVPPAA